MRIISQDCKLSVNFDFVTLGLIKNHGESSVVAIHDNKGYEILCSCLDEDSAKKVFMKIHIAHDLGNKVCYIEELVRMISEEEIRVNYSGIEDD